MSWNFRWCLLLIFKVVYQDHTSLSMGFHSERAGACLGPRGLRCCYRWGLFMTESSAALQHFVVYLRWMSGQRSSFNPLLEMKFSSVQDGIYALGKAIIAPPHLSEVLPKLPLKWWPWWRWSIFITESNDTLQHFVVYFRQRNGQRNLDVSQ